MGVHDMAHVFDQLDAGDAVLEEGGVEEKRGARRVLFPSDGEAEGAAFCKKGHYFLFDDTAGSNFAADLVRERRGFDYLGGVALGNVSGGTEADAGLQAAGLAGGCQFRVAPSP